ncbi:transcriptional regulator, partial [Pectobacterium parmentieri]|nr:transcriptional regulator [Pectobacterium parmentieri]
MSVHSPSANTPSDMAEQCPMVNFVNLIAGKWAISILY